MGTRNLGPAFWLRSTARRASRLAKRTSPIDSAAHAPRFSCSRPLSRLRLFTLANLVRQPCVCVCVCARACRAPEFETGSARFDLSPAFIEFIARLLAGWLRPFPLSCSSLSLSPFSSFFFFTSTIYTRPVGPVFRNVFFETWPHFIAGWNSNFFFQ